jgi:hypothetical protein
MTTATALDRYRAALASIPPPGSGCHVSLLAVANRGVLAGRDPELILGDIRDAIPSGARRVPDREIADAIQKALADHQGGTFTPRPRPEPVVRDGKATLRRIIAQGTIDTEVDLWEQSPIRLWGAPEDDPALLLETLYQPTDLLWIGERFDAGILGKTIRPAGEWITHFRAGGPTASHIIPNPLTGMPAMKKTGDAETLRGDGNVQTFRFCVVEFDTLSLADQIKFWSAVKLPILALIGSGGKSVHAWLDVAKLAPVVTTDQWDTEIKRRLYDRLLTPLGVDTACSNPARLSRLPGHYRTETNAYQRLLWLSPDGRTVRDDSLWGTSQGEERAEQRHRRDIPRGAPDVGPSCGRPAEVGGPGRSGSDRHSDVGCAASGRDAFGQGADRRGNRGSREDLAGRHVCQGRSGSRMRRGVPHGG